MDPCSRISPRSSLILLLLALRLLWLDRSSARAPISPRRLGRFLGDVGGLHTGHRRDQDLVLGKRPAEELLEGSEALRDRGRPRAGLEVDQEALDVLPADIGHPIGQVWRGAELVKRFDVADNR
jgi:hypothetical protein